MSDLVQRLRDPARCVSWAAADRIMGEAADEIERLAALAASNFSAAVDAQERLDAAIAKARADERERCAKVCEDADIRQWGYVETSSDLREALAYAIRQPVDNLPTE